MQLINCDPFSFPCTLVCSLVYSMVLLYVSFFLFPTSDPVG